MSKPSPPPAPDYVGAAQAQGTANKEAAIASSILSNPNIYTPYGTQTVNYSGALPSDVPVPTVTQTLTPAQQAIFNTQQTNQQGLGNLASQGISNVSNVLGQTFSPNLPAAPINPGTTAQQAIMERLQPQLQLSDEQLQSQLANQGIPLGSEAYGNAMRVQNQGKNDLLSQAALQGINLDQGARQQALQEQSFLREQPLNEISALMSGSQVQAPNFQAFQPTGTAAAPIYQANQALGQYGTDVYNAQTAGQANFNTGLMSTAALAAMYY